MTITEFLLARIAEDEASVRVNWNLTTGLTDELWWGTPFQPSRVLAECVAKRLLLGLHEATPYYGLDRYGRWLPHEGEPKAWYCECQSVDGMIQGEAPCLTTRALALPYVDHPEYREEWRLDTP